ncbi:hypothetical protein FJZ26_01880 [Candidatus Parvarchaeota archaeon]|nr:hypothetical protein [Candidatus Parvarchaeota archaeon]
MPTFVEGKNLGVENTAVYLDCANVSDSFDPFTTKNAAFNFSTMDCEALFGAYRVLKTGFTIHAYNCVNMQRCFEMDSCKNCTDSYFCHNCENLDNCMFCFNTKSKRFAIGNIEMPREKYLEIKQRLVRQMAQWLEKNGRLDYDIYDVLSERKGK